jgi:ribosomal-protein-alanine N-acetyltransferase
VTRSNRPPKIGDADDPRPARVRVALDTRVVTERLVLRAFRVDDVRAQRAFVVENEEHLRPWSPRPLAGESPGTLTDAAKKIATARRDWRNDRGYAFAAFLRAPSSRREAQTLIARVALNGLVRGNFQNAYLGYLIAAAYEGKGLAREAVAGACDFAFGVARLHRVQAAIMPHNERSLRLVRALGFRQEGASRMYLMIDGDWRDHLLFAVTADEWRLRESGGPRGGE